MLISVGDALDCFVLQCVRGILYSIQEAGTFGKVTVGLALYASHGKL